MNVVPCWKNELRLDSTCVDGIGGNVGMFSHTHNLTFYIETADNSMYNLYNSIQYNISLPSIITCIQCIITISTRTIIWFVGITLSLKLHANDLQILTDDY